MSSRSWVRRGGFAALLIAASGLWAQDFQAAVVGSLPAPRINSQEAIRAKLASLEAGPQLSPFEDPYLILPSLVPPYSPGALQPSHLDRGLKVLNAFRFLAGLSDTVTLDSEWTKSAQYGAALLAIRNLGISHTPAYPEGISLPRDFYDKGYAATTTSNLAFNYGDLWSANRAFMDDSDFLNIYLVGHRRWILNPTMTKIGAGMAKRIVVLKVFEQGRPFSGADTSYVAWPGVGDFPLGWFQSGQAWSLSLNPLAFHKGLKVDPGSFKIMLTRDADGRKWEFSQKKNAGFVTLDQSEVAHPFCLIFRPDDLEDLTDYDKFDVRIEGVTDGESQPIWIHYQTRFFSPGPRIIPKAESDYPAQVVFHSGFTTETKFPLMNGLVEGNKTTIGDGYPLTSFFWYADGPRGILPIGIEVNRDGVIHSPGEVIVAGPSGFTSVRFVYTEDRLSYSALFWGKSFTDWGHLGETLEYPDRTPLGQILVRLEDNQW